MVRTEPGFAVEAASETPQAGGPSVKGCDELPGLWMSRRGAEGGCWAPVSETKRGDGEDDSSQAADDQPVHAHVTRRRKAVEDEPVSHEAGRRAQDPHGDTRGKPSIPPCPSGRGCCDCCKEKHEQDHVSLEERGHQDHERDCSCHHNRVVSFPSAA